MPLLRIVCPPDRTGRVVELLETDTGATGITVVPGAGRPGGDLIHADVPRAHIDPLLASIQAAPASATGEVHLAVQPSEVLLPPAPPSPDDDAVVWAEVVHEVHTAGRLSWINVLLIVIAAAAAAWILTEVLSATGQPTAPQLGRLRELTLFIAHPDALSVMVALLAGVAGALAITLPGARGLVGVFVSVTTIPAAANIGVALANRDLGGLGGATLQLLGNVGGLLAAGAVTLALRHRGRAPRTLHEGDHHGGR